MKALLRGAHNFCNCDSHHLDSNDFGELQSMKSLPVTALRYGGALSTISKMNVQLGSLRCIGKKGIYPSEIEIEEKRTLEKRLNILNETLIEHMSKGSEQIKYPEIFSPLKCKKIRIGAIEIWLFLLFWPFIS